MAIKKKSHKSGFLSSRKGIFFTLMAIVIVSFIILSERALSPIVTSSSSDTTAARTRVATITAFMHSWEEHAKTSLGIVTYLSLQNISNTIGKDINYTRNINATIEYCMLNRTFSNNCLLTNQTLNGTLKQLSNIAQSNIGLNVTFFIHNIWISEEQPMEVIAWMNISYNISDTFATFIVPGKIIRASVDVTGITDPVYQFAKSNGNTTNLRVFNKSTHLKTQMNISTFTNLYDNKTYLPLEGKAPSVLQRFEGKINETSACCGIESIFKYSELPGDVQVNPRMVNWSLVDHQFMMRYNVTGYNCLFDETGRITSLFTESQLRLQTDRIQNVYNVSLQSTLGCS